jgi:hypothetical protein
MISKIALLFLLFPTVFYGQNTMTLKSGKVYPATSNWNFICPNYALSGELTVQIAKTANGGLLKLSSLSTHPEFIIKGTVYIYLTNGAILTCTDKGDFKNSDEQIASFFTFTPSEMQLLKKQDIQSIRYNIVGKSNDFSSQIGNFTAFNKQSYYTTTYKLDKTSTYQTSTEIVALYP